MSRKTTTCHVCGEEISRFAEHLLAKHKLADFKKEKEVRAERERFVLLNSFTYESDLKRDLNAISGYDDSIDSYTFQDVCNLLRSKGWKIYQVRYNVNVMFEFNGESVHKAYCVTAVGKL
jgi:hypothetical protein